MVAFSSKTGHVSLTTHYLDLVVANNHAIIRMVTLRTHTSIPPKVRIKLDTPRAIVQTTTLEKLHMPMRAVRLLGLDAERAPIALIELVAVLVALGVVLDGAAAAVFAAVHLDEVVAVAAADEEPFAGGGGVGGVETKVVGETEGFDGVGVQRRGGGCEGRGDEEGSDD